MTKSISKNHKNSLIELMRFLFALWVLYYHGFVPYRVNGFGDGFLAVEFFFVLSGFYLIRTIDKYKDLPTKQGLKQFLKHRFASIAIPFLINEVFVLYRSFVIDPSIINFSFGFLWYIRDLFIAISVIFILRKRCSSDKKFYQTLALLSAIAFFAFYPIWWLAWPGGPFRSIASIPLGMFAALIPKLSANNQNKSKGFLTKFAIVLGLLVTSLICLKITYLPKTTLLRYILVIIIYPAMIYFASCINFNCAFLNWLGSLSFLIYSFQCPLRILQHYGLTNSTHLFIILMAMVLAYSLIDNIVKLKKSKTQKGLI